MTTFVHAADGRRLAVQVSGKPTGYPVIYLHGTPGSRLGLLPRGRVLYELGVRLISFDRPGYGLSDRRVPRLVKDVVPDVANLWQ
jgi:pimeloyl-ACP methyl ester carboxylesterase